MPHRLVSLLFALSLCAGPVVGQSADVPLLTVTGEGRIALAPDLATLGVGLRVETRQPDDAIDGLADGLRDIRAALADAGIPDAAVRTESQTLRPVYSRPQGDPPPPREIAGYVAETVFRVEVTDLERLGRVLEDVADAGANLMTGVRFALADPAAARIAAQQAAIADAQATAQALAAEAGLALGRVQSLTADYNGGGPRPMARAEAVAADAMPIAPGEIEITATVRLSYTIAR